MVLTHKYFDGKVPGRDILTDYDKETFKEFEHTMAEMENFLNQFRFREALKEAINLARIGNKYLADTEPWKLAKSDMNRTATVLNLSMQITVNLAIAFEPFLPFSSQKIKQLVNKNDVKWDELGSIDILKEGHCLNSPELLFEKIEDDIIEKQIQKLLDTKKSNELKAKQANPIKESIAYDDFAKLDIRVGKVLECMKVPKADKLLQFKIDDGLGGRTILSGIAEYYQPEELTGKTVCFIANLEPRKIKGIVSQGMLLSAESFAENLRLIHPDTSLEPGSEIS
jgi:methionyl-tRNA synthetase